MMTMIFRVPAGPGHLTCHPRWFLALRLSPLIVQPQQAIPYLPLIVAFFNIQENTAIQFYSPRNRRGHSTSKQNLYNVQQLNNTFTMFNSWATHRQCSIAEQHLYNVQQPSNTSTMLNSWTRPLQCSTAEQHLYNVEPLSNTSTMFNSWATSLQRSTAEQHH